MTLIILLSLLVCIMGALVYLLSTRAKLAELGRLAFAVGLFVVLLEAPARIVRL